VERIRKGEEEAPEPTTSTETAAKSKDAAAG
jgi:hypothetical protein